MNYSLLHNCVYVLYVFCLKLGACWLAEGTLHLNNSHLEKYAFYISFSISVANNHVYSSDQQNGTRVHSPSCFLFLSLSLPPAHLPSALDGWEAETISLFLVTL